MYSRKKKKSYEGASWRVVVDEILFFSFNCLNFFFFFFLQWVLSLHFIFFFFHSFLPAVVPLDCLALCGGVYPRSRLNTVYANTTSRGLYTCIICSMSLFSFFCRTNEPFGGTLMDVIYFFFVRWIDFQFHFFPSTSWDSVNDLIMSRYLFSIRPVLGNL